MAVYGSVEGVLQILASGEDDTFAENDQARIGALLRVVSLIIEEKTGVVFSDSPDAATMVVPVPWPTPVLWLPQPAVSITSVTADQDWTGTAWSGGTLVAPMSYRLAGPTSLGTFRTLLRQDGVAWYGTYQIIGVWGATVDGVPPQIDAIANKITADLFRKDNASPAGFTGPDGATVPIRNAFKEPEVVAVLEHFNVNASAVVI